MVVLLRNSFFFRRVSMPKALWMFPYLLKFLIFVKSRLVLAYCSFC